MFAQSNEAFTHPLLDEMTTGSEENGCASRRR